MAQPLLEVKHLKTQFRTKRGTVTAVDDVSFSVNQGDTLGIVGESGCGKSVTSLSILQLLPHAVGFCGQAVKSFIRARILPKKGIRRCAG